MKPITPSNGRITAAATAGALLVVFEIAGPITVRGADATAPSGVSDQSLQEVVVVGMRANLEKSLDIKKDASIVLDSINSTELGRFPDADVADSLAHLPGITNSDRFCRTDSTIEMTKAPDRLPMPPAMVAITAVRNTRMPL